MSIMGGNGKDDGDVSLCVRAKKPDIREQQ